ncbi:MAG: spore cortex-lytic enzyme [Clostridia bacterium]|nr:spore cortex-lytic enzyme [Clostridia bacterium]
MRKYLKQIIFALLAVIMISYILISPNSVSVLSKIGSQGTEVRNIQSRLKAWGYYNGNVDGIYGWRTAQAVRSFQAKNGLSVDGVAGPATLEKIGLPTGQAAGSSYESNLNLLARLINAEARGEPYEGQVAVGAVILNRVKHPSFPNTIAGVIYQEGAFTSIVDGQVNAQMQAQSYTAARDALNGWDPSGGAIYYYNPATATNSWIRSRPYIKTIGNHVFCK